MFPTSLCCGHKGLYLLWSQGTLIVNGHCCSQVVYDEYFFWSAKDTERSFDIESSLKLDNICKSLFF